jgi:ElaB/YqjD/DUF883 family membrane-anchored ribosome-binding protein
MAAETLTKKDTPMESPNIDQLSKDISVLKADLASVVSTLKELGVHGRDTAVEEGRRRYAIARSTTSDQVAGLRRTAEDYGHQATDAVREKPATALLVAVGIGMLFGILTARR